MDYFVRVMHGLGIITVATLTLEAGGDRGPRGLGAEPVPARASRSSHPPCSWGPGSHEQMPNKHIPVLTQWAIGTVLFPRTDVHVRVREVKQKADRPWNKMGQRQRKMLAIFKAMHSLNTTADTGTFSLSLSLSIQTLNLMVVCLVLYNVQVLRCD